MKYIVLQDFWLRDVCLRKGQIITDPVSPRWLQLRLIGVYSDLETSKGLSESQIDTIEKIEELQNANNEIGNIDVSAVVNNDKIRKKRKYVKRKRNDIIYNKPELSEIIVKEIN